MASFRARNGMIAGAGLVAAAGLLFALYQRAQATAHMCPANLATAERLVLVTAPSMNDLPPRCRHLSAGHRARRGVRWVRLSRPRSACGGWPGQSDFRSLASDGEPLKVEGDNRSPAGVFALGSTFGFDVLDAPGHIALERQQHICVDDVASPYYDQIVSRAEAGPGTSAEEMRDIATYRRGIVIDLPRERAQRTGSCIFVHIWNGSGIGTGGCVGLPEPSVAALQTWGGGGKAVIAILPQQARQRLSDCLPAE